MEINGEADASVPALGQREDECATFLINLNSRFSNAAKRQQRFAAISEPQLRNTQDFASIHTHVGADEILEILRYNCGNRSLCSEQLIVLSISPLLTRRSFYRAIYVPDTKSSPE